MTERCMLVVAHPGHELRIYGWVQRMRPIVLAITDGSGGAGASRLESSRKALNDAGARVGPIFGRYSDRELYARLMENDYAAFLECESEIRGCIVSEEISTIVADTADGYNPMHDICRLLVNSAVSRLGQRQPSNCSFTLVRHPRRADAEYCDHLELSEEEFERKKFAAENYSELRGEVASILQDLTWEEFRTEYFYPEPGVSLREATPYYETYGASQVASGRYKSVLRYAQHVKPLADILAGRTVGCAS